MLPSVAGHRAVKPSYVDKLESLDRTEHPAQDSSPSLGKNGMNESGPTGLRRPPLALVSKLCASVSGDALAPDGSAAKTIRANYSGRQGTTMVLWVLLCLRNASAVRF